ncbi:MAG: hypothetical protein ACTSU5_09475 [Promethearchaeota archaeon]
MKLESRKITALLAISLGILVLSIVAGTSNSNGPGQAPEPKSSFSNLSFTCDAKPTGTTNSYEGERWEVLTLTSTWDETVTDASLFHDLSTGGYSWKEEDLSISPGTTVTATITLNTTVDDVDIHFKIRASNGVTLKETAVITVRVKFDEKPHFNVNDRALQLSQYRGSVTLQWPAAVDNVGIKTYTVYRSMHEFTAPTDSGVEILSDCVTGETWTDTTGEGQTEYWYCVSGVDYTGNSTMSAASQYEQFTSIKSILIDTIPPAIDEFNINNTISVTSVAKDAKILIPRGYKTTFVINASEASTITMEINSSTLGRAITFSENKWEKPYFNLFAYEYEWDTREATEQHQLLAGEYDLYITITDANGNPKTYAWPNAVQIGDPPVQIPWVTIIVVIAAVGGGAVGGVAVWKVRGKRQVNQEVQAIQRRRKGDVYKGASALGRSSGIEAESLRRKRLRRASDGAAKPTAGGGKKVPAPSPAKPRGGGPTRSRPAPVKSSTKSPVKIEKIKPSEVTSYTKKVESSVDIGRRMDFLASKVTSLETVFAMATLLVEKIPDRPTCDECGRELAGAWEKCPWCIVEEKKDELGMKQSLQSLGDTATQCPTCGRVLLPIWGGKCPYCLSKK